MKFYCFGDNISFKTNSESEFMVCILIKVLKSFPFTIIFLSPNPLRGWQLLGSVLTKNKRAADLPGVD